MNAPKLTGNRCQCTACGECFNGVQPFDKHRTGEPGLNRRCLTVPEMIAVGFIRNVRGFWCDRASADHAMRPRAQGFPSRLGAGAMAGASSDRQALKTRAGATP